MVFFRHAVIAASVVLLAGLARPLHAAEHITLRNGFDLICDHREVAGDRVRLYMTGSGPNFMEVSSGDIASSEFVQLPVVETPQPAPIVQATPTPAEIREMAAKAGAAHDLDVELLASVSSRAFHRPFAVQQGAPRKPLTNCEHSTPRAFSMSDSRDEADERCPVQDDIPVGQ